MARSMKKIGDVGKKPTPPVKEKKVKPIDDNYKNLSLAELRKLYVKTQTEKNKLEDGAFCHHCGKHLPRDRFYVSRNTGSGLVPTCKSCLFTIATNFNHKTKESNETEESIKEALKLADKPFISEVYDAAYLSCHGEANDANRHKYIWTGLISILSSLPQYSNLTWKDSDEEVLDDAVDKKKATKRMRDFWGEGFADSDLVYLDKEYKDWVTRNEVNTKPMEEIIKRICFKQLEIYKATLAGTNTKDLDRTYQDLLDSANLKPKQLNTDALASDRVFGQLIELWEQEKPIPECEPEFKDIDGIGRYFSVYVLGHLAKMLGFENRFSRMYEEEIAKYTVKKPEFEEDSELYFEAMFGKETED